MLNHFGLRRTRSSGNQLPELTARCYGHHAAGFKESNLSVPWPPMAPPPLRHRPMDSASVVDGCGLLSAAAQPSRSAEGMSFAMV